MDVIAGDTWWGGHFLPAGKSKAFDYMSRDGNTVVEVQRRPQGWRGFYAGIMRLALAAEQDSKLKRACLVIDTTGLSMDRLRDEWARIRRLFHGEVSRRLSLVALQENKTWIDPEEPFIRKIADAFEHNAVLNAGGQLMKTASFAGRRYFETVKVLLIRWLRNEGPVSIGQLVDEVGCTYPTIRQSLRRLESKKYLSRESGRRVQLSRFPQETWREMLALAPSMRQSLRFTDESGETPNPSRLLERLNKNRPEHVAVGGVTAARHWHPEFDLHGTPRLDLVLHAPDGVVDLRFLKHLDPALKQISNPDASPALVIHPLIRATSFFAESEQGQAPLADPIEAVLDLQELGLSPQANELLAHFRKEVRGP